MKIGIFLETFTNVEFNKDPGIIALGLVEHGMPVTFFCNFCSPEIKEKINIKEINNKKRNEISYWENSDIKILIIYSWLSLRYSKMIKAARSAGLMVILKLDSDGYLLYPLKPSYLKVFGLDNSLKAKIKYLIRIIQWNLFPRVISKYRINQIKQCNAVIIETPFAKENLDYSLSFWQEKKLSEKIKIIPNPINIKDAQNITKKDIITCIGRWDDKRKNAKALIQVLSTLQTHWQINLIGHGSLNLLTEIKKNNPNLYINTYEQVDHKEVLNKLTETKIFFSPSISESFGLASAEALCCGCSVVGGPLPSFKYFTNENKSGTLAENFDVASFKKALETDIDKWDKNLYRVEKILTYWQKELNKGKIINQIIDLIKKL